MLTRVTSIRLVERSTMARTYDAIELVIGDLHVRCDLVCDRDIRLARRIADSHGAHWYVAPHLQERVARALKAQRRI